jgi:DNA invertase Pin-like site-specific DNA recombinase
LGGQQIRPARRVWASKTALLAGGADVVALRYQRASGDKKQEGKSVGDQATENLRTIAAQSWRDGGSYTDNARSASRHARKEREDFERLIDDIIAGAGDVLVVWEISRKERDLAVYVKIRDLCIAEGLNFWMVGSNLYDLRDKNDRMGLGIQAVQAEWLADSIRDNVKRGIDLAAEAGRPHGPTTYGYRRIYHQRTKALVRQEPDDEIRQAVAADGTVSTYTHADMVREIFTRVAAGDPLITIERDFNARGVPSPQGLRWLRGVIRKVTLNPVYIGKCVLRGEVIGDGQWPALVSEETYWACRRLLEDPARTTTRSSRAKYLLSYIATCGVCGGPMCGRMQRSPGWQARVYTCLGHKHTVVVMAYLDEYIERTLLAWLSTADVHEALHRPIEDRDSAAARAEAQRLRAELEDYRKLAEAGQIKATDYVRFERGLTERITAAEEQAHRASMPPVLRGRLGARAAREWAALADNIAVKRDIIREVLRIDVHPALSAAHVFNPDRVRLAWTYGDPQHVVRTPALADAA